MADDLRDRISDMDKELGSVATEQVLHTRIITKIEDTIDRMKDVVESLNRLIAIHDEKIRNNERGVDHLEKLVEQQRDEMNRDIKELEKRVTEKIDTVEERIIAKMNELEKKWDDNQTKQDKKDEAKANRFDGIKLLIENWKWLFLGIIFALGIMTGKTGFFTSLFHLMA